MMVIFLILLMANKVSFCEENWSGIKKSEVSIPKPTMTIDYAQHTLDEAFSGTSVGKEERSFTGYQGMVDEIYKRFDVLFGKWDEELEEVVSYSKSVEAEEILFKRDLRPIRDRYLYEAVVFRTSSGKPVYLSITQSANCPTSSKCDIADKFFMVFTGEDKHEFVRIKDVVNVGFLISGSKRV